MLSIKNILYQLMIVGLFLPSIVPRASLYAQDGAQLNSLFALTALALQNSQQNMSDENNSDQYRACNPCGVTTDLSGVYTAISTCCNGTFTVLAEIETEINGIFTTLSNTATVLVAIITDLSGVFTALEACCEGTFTAIEAANDLNGVYTMLNTLYEGICSPQFIRQSDFDAGTTFTITQPGLYMFAEDITFSPAAPQPAILITSDEVTVDMCGMSLMQGNSTPLVEGFFVQGTATLPARSNVTIRNGIIKNFTFVGILVGDLGINTACTLIRLHNLTIDGGSSTATVIGIALVGSAGDGVISNSVIEQCIVSQVFAQGINILDTEYITVRNCSIVNNGNASSTFVGLNIVNNSIKAIVDTVLIGDNGTPGVPLSQFTGVLMTNINQCLFRNCRVLNNFASNEVRGFSLTGFSGGTSLDNQFQNCLVSNNQGAADVIGFDLSSSSTTAEDSYGTVLQECLATDNISTSSKCYGFKYTTVANCRSINCSAFDNISTTTAVGFYISEAAIAGTGCKRCSWSYCTASGNTGFDAAHSWGFDAVATTTDSNVYNAYIANIAYRNGPLGLAETAQQIATDDVQTGGVPANSVLPATVGVTSINDLDDLIVGNPYINVRLADSLVL